MWQPEAIGLTKIYYTRRDALMENLSKVMGLGVGKKVNECQKRQGPKLQEEPRHAHFWLHIPSPQKLLLAAQIFKKKPSKNF